MISIIVPVYNGEKTLGHCLSAVFANIREGAAEVIVVDDKSTDSSADIAKRYPCTLIELPENKGSGAARNAGMEKARGDIVLFIDADIVINGNTLGIIKEDFSRNPGPSAVVGILDAECGENFFSQYKNCYMNYTFSRMPSYVDFLFSSILAVRKSEYLCFKSDKFKTDDTELGQRYKLAGKVIFLDKRLTVQHLKKYTLASLLKNEFQIPFCWAKLFVKYMGLSDVLSKKRFAHAPLRQLAGLMMLPCAGISALFGSLYLAGLLEILFISTQAGFLKFLIKKRTPLFVAKALLLIHLDVLFMSAGAVSGFVYYGFLCLAIR
ncbi:MAG: glycosyltransferase family 2 protein [Candidatus Omnitrophica bacterium]|nr:glycosyltransferase family 2 protein [Candidatus Omnitrophota bacterium]